MTLSFNEIALCEPNSLERLFKVDMTPEAAGVWWLRDRMVAPPDIHLLSVS
tara:strand:+ start:196 stop:348 length:153 start_codon:yes stop_codon:yes gene_type:complete